MRKSGIVFSFLTLAVLLVSGLVFPTGVMMWLASSSAPYICLRIFLMALLAALLLTDPPRHKGVRAFVGIVTIVIGGWCLQSTYQNHTQFFDTMSILGACFVMGAAALEYERRATDGPIVADWETMITPADNYRLKTTAN